MTRTWVAELLAVVADCIESWSLVNSLEIISVWVVISILWLPHHFVVLGSLRASHLGSRFPFAGTEDHHHEN